ncbi:MAG: nucleoside diphosphate kinase regulator [Porticoccaceae bacterium]|jgi:regulator of nucleoside diphosphate kinase|nr:nucleoside diphosphate kinase regulator [Porticoccaceae bacterium]
MSSTTIIVAESDYQRLSSLIDSAQSAAAEALDAELSRAEIVADPLLPPDTVAMGSTVTFRDQDSGEQTTVTLVYPREADVDRMRISVLSPVGSALIGLGIGGAIDWPVPGGRQRRLEVIAVKQAAREVAEP